MVNYNEDDQVNQLRSIVKKYGLIAVVVVVIFLASLYGRRAWETHKVESYSKASLNYEQLLEKVKGADEQGIVEATQFAKENQDIYGVMMGLELAKHFAGDKAYDKAESMLSIAKANTDDKVLLALIDVRLARIMFQQGQLEQALSLLNTVTLAGSQLQVNLVKGDILSKLHRYSDAISSYQLALALAADDAVLKRDLSLKIEQAMTLEKTYKPEQAPAENK